MNALPKVPTMKPVSSSNVEAIGFFNGVMHVRFKSGAHYSYAGVPEEIFKAAHHAPSIGGYISQHIVQKFDHRKH